MLNKNFFIAINKPTNWTSSDVVIKVRNILYRKFNEKFKVGHMGTLDPGAGGVLLLGVNKANRLFDIMQLKTKSYRGRLTFGISTDTQDSYGKIISNSALPTLKAIKGILNDFIGKIEQIPPKYSAIKINGQKAYDMARKEKDFKIPSRCVTIFSLDIVRYIEVDGFLESIDFDIVCSSGTYIRTLFSDIAKKANVDGYMSYLIRTKIANISLDMCIDINDLDNIEKGIIPQNKVLENLLDIYTLNEIDYTKFHDGNKVKLNIDKDIIALKYIDDIKFIAKNENGKYKAYINLE